MYRKYFLLATIIFWTINGIIAQSKIVSPYSALGLGDLIDQNFYHSGLMGGQSAAYNSPNLYNSVNPAALGFLKMTAFDLGANLGYHQLEEAEQNSTNISGGIEYLSLAFPLRNPISEVLERQNTDLGWGMAFSLKPYTKSGYNFTDVSWTTDSINVRSNVRGKGGTYKFNFSNGWRYKELAFGLNLGYLFGNLTKSRELIHINLDNPYDQYFTDKVSVSSFVWDLGVMYNLTLNKSEKNSKKIKNLSLGIYANSNHNFNSSVDQFYWAQRTNWAGSFALERRDTILNQTRSLSGVLPANLGIGLYYNDAVHHTFGINMDWTNWSAFTHEILEPSSANSFSNGLKISLGGSYTKEMSSYSFSNRISYKYGFYWIKDPRQIDGEQIQDIGFTLGSTMPLYFTRQVSHLHLGFKLGRLGRKNSLTDSYATFTLGLTFNDNKWFLKRKFN